MSRAQYSCGFQGLGWTQPMPEQMGFELTKSLLQAESGLPYGFNDRQQPTQSRQRGCDTAVNRAVLFFEGISSSAAI
jgi:hypothetical protein